MSFRKPFLLLLCLGACARAASAEPDLSPESLIRIALEENPELNAARLLIAEAEGRAAASGRLSNPEIVTELAAGPQSEGRIEIAVTQRFPLTARLREERELSALGIEMARLEVEEKARQLAHTVRLAFLELASTRAALLVLKRQGLIAQQLVGSLRTAADQGQVSPLDAGLAEVNAGAFAVTAEALRAEEEIASGRLASLLGRSATRRMPLASLPALPESPPSERRPSLRPDLRLGELAVKAGALNVSLAQSARWEDVGVGFFSEVERLESDTEKLVGIRIAIPLPVWENGAGRIAAQRAAREREARELEALRRSVENKVVTAHRAMSARFRAARQAESQILPAARRHLADTEAAHQRGEIDLETLLRSRDRLAELESAALAARKSYHLAHAAWLAALGELTNPK